jgi:hypothetical protein
MHDNDTADSLSQGAKKKNKSKAPTNMAMVASVTFNFRAKTECS